MYWIIRSSLGAHSLRILSHQSQVSPSDASLDGSVCFTNNELLPHHHQDHSAVLVTMARTRDQDSGGGTQGSRKQGTTAVTSPVKATRRVQAKRVVKKKLLRRISSGMSERRQTSRSSPVNTDSRDREAPTFYQPGPQRGDGLPETEPEDSEEEQGPGTLPDGERYKAMGKTFALKVWPWPSPNWWVTSLERNEQPGKAIQPGSPEARKNQFTTFVGFDMDLSSEEWGKPHFKREVCFFFHHFTHLTTLCNYRFVPVYERGTSDSI